MEGLLIKRMKAETKVGTQRRRKAADSAKDGTLTKHQMFRVIWGCAKRGSQDQATSFIDEHSNRNHDALNLSMAIVLNGFRANPRESQARTGRLANSIQFPRAEGFIRLV
jgi:hypothetical protein